jgi:nicotinamidase-related amidase
MKTALIVIDAQESFRYRDYFTDRDLPGYLTAQNELIAGAAAKGLPIIRIFHSDGPAVTSNPWSNPGAVAL